MENVIEERKLSALLPNVKRKKSMTTKKPLSWDFRKKGGRKEKDKFISGTSPGVVLFQPNLYTIYMAFIFYRKYKRWGENICKLFI